MRGRNADKPWIGTFGFEPEDGPIQVPMDPAAVTQGKSSDERDAEKQGHIESVSGSSADGDKSKDPNLVGFDGPDDTLNPQNWAPTKKWSITTRAYLDV